jgi:hypothetical protein
MANYVLLVYYPTEEDRRRRERDMSSEEWEAERQSWDTFRKEAQEAGIVVSHGGLQGVDAATTVRVRDNETHITDGPFAESKELLAGYWMIDVPDLDSALGWAARIPAAKAGSVEVRPTWG